MQHPAKKQRSRRVSTKAALIITAALAVLAAAFVLLLPVLQPPTSPDIIEAHEPSKRTLALHDASTLESVTITPSRGSGYTLVNQNGSLMLQGDSGLLPLRESASEAILSAVTLLTVQDTVSERADDVKEHLADMGLKPPRVTALSRFSDGREELIELGGAVPDTSYSYFRWSGDDGIYMCDVGAADALDVPADRLLPVPSPELEAALIDRAALTLPDGERIEMQFSVNESGTVSGYMTFPFRYPMSAETAETVLRALCGIRLGAAIAESAGTGDFGFDEPICTIDIHRREGMRAETDDAGQIVYKALPEADFHFTLGREEDEYFYTCLYEGSAYLVSKLLCGVLTAADAQIWASRNPFEMDSELRGITVHANGKALEARLIRAERVLPNNELETDANGNIVYDTEVLINGAESTPEQFEALAGGLAAVTVSGKLPAGWTQTEKAPRWSAELEGASGERREITAYRYDAFSDAIAVDGTALFYLNSEALELALGELMP